MNQVDEDHVLEVPGRDAIQLEEGKKAVSIETLLLTHIMNSIGRQ